MTRDRNLQPHKRGLETWYTVEGRDTNGRAFRWHYTTKGRATADFNKYVVAGTLYFCRLGRKRKIIYIRHTGE